MDYTEIDFNTLGYPVNVKVSYTNTMYGETLTYTTTFNTADEFSDFCENFDTAFKNVSNLQVISIEETIIETEPETAEITTVAVNTGVITTFTESLFGIQTDTRSIIVIALPCALAVVGIIFVIRKVVKYFKRLTK